MFSFQQLSEFVFLFPPPCGILEETFCTNSFPDKGCDFLGRRGFIHTKDEIKFLVLYAMQYLDFPVTFASIVDICTWCDDGFSYFDLQEAFQEMLKSGHIQAAAGESTDMLYSITPPGCDAAQVFEKNLPAPVRESAQASALRVVRQLRRDSAISTQTTQQATNDFLVHLSMEDVFSVQMHVVSRSQAALLERNFRQNAENIYHVLLDSMIEQNFEKDTEPNP